MQSVLRSFARKFVQTCLGAPGSGWSRKKKAIFFFLPAVDAYTIYCWPLKVCDWSGHIFGASANPRSLTKKLATSRSCSVHGGQRDTKYWSMWHSSCWYMRHSWLTKFGVLCLNQLVCCRSLFACGFLQSERRYPCRFEWKITKSTSTSININITMYCLL